MKKSFSAIIFSLLLISIFGLAFNVQATEDPLTRAYKYLLSRYNPKLGLVSESEDRGVNAVGGTTVNNTYWIYSDNLWAAEALKPYDLSVAANISKTVQSYIREYGKSMLFEVVLGEVIPTTIHGKRNIVAYNGTVNGSWVQILLDRHQFIDDPEGIFYDADKYADLCFYMTIDYWLLEDIHASEYWFRTGESLWNYSTNNGFYDEAARNCKPVPLYQNMKLGLFLLAQRATGFSSNITSTVQSVACSYQKENGGIASLSYMNGTVYGTANVETTSALLLAYDEQLIDRLHKRQSPALARIESLLADLNSTHSSLLSNYTELQKHYDSLQRSYNNLTVRYDQLLSLYNTLKSEHEIIISEQCNVRNLIYMLTGIAMAGILVLIATTIYFAKRKSKEIELSERS